MNTVTAPSSPRLGIDENGLGPRLGPLVVTAVLADVTRDGVRRLTRPLPGRLQADLNDSKSLVSNRNISLAEAWARVVVEQTTGQAPQTPGQLLGALSLQSDAQLRAGCPPRSEKQCFYHEAERFQADQVVLRRVRSHLTKLHSMGIRIGGAQSDIICAGRLNALKAQGVHRFAADLHAMERLVLSFRARSSGPVLAICGKVGGINKYEPFFGPLSSYLRTVLDEQRAQSAYQFPQVGEVRFVRDADATDPLVMLASLIGKYVRELLMNRISSFYGEHVPDALASPSGYHDPITRRFIAHTQGVRRRLRITPHCFERVGASGTLR